MTRKTGTYPYLRAFLLQKGYSTFQIQLKVDLAREHCLPITTIEVVRETVGVLYSTFNHKNMSEDERESIRLAAFGYNLI